MATVNLKAFPFSADVTCPKCSNIITLYDPDGSEYCVCSQCRSFIRFTGSNQAIIQKQAPPVRTEPVLKLGARGVLKGVDFKVIGYIEKKELNSHYAWREYILYNYEKGYATLAEFDGHWNYVVGKEFYADLGALKPNTWDFKEYMDTDFNLYNKYTAVTTALIGEFDWDILTERAQVREYIAPPLMLVLEQGKSGGGGDFYLAEYTEAKEIAEAFKADPDTFPVRDGIGANQPSLFQNQWEPIKKVTPILILILAVLAFVLSIVNPSTVVMNRNYDMFSDTTKINEFKPFATPYFEIKGTPAALNILVSSGVDNNWMEANTVLVNEQTNQSWDVTESVEYYHGYEDGESWSEGGQESESLLSHIPPGKYHLNVYPASGDRYRNTVHITVTARPVLWTNFWLILLALLVYPAFCWWRVRSFEKKRWMNSDYSPYVSQQEDD